MSFLRFKHAYVGLLGLAGLSAFAIPAPYTRKAVPDVQALFSPISWPVRSVAEKLSSKFDSQVAEENRTKGALLDENEELRQQVAKLSHDLDELRKISAGFEGLGDLKERCRSYPVVFNDSGTSDSLAISTSSLSGVRAGMYALLPSGIAGIVERAGVGGAQIRLVTDRNFPGVRGYFTKPARDVHNEPVFLRLKTDPVLVKGVGNGQMVIAMQRRDVLEQAGVGPGAWVSVEDSEWHPDLQGFRIGTVTEVRPRRDSSLHADVIVKPATDLRRVRRVMVLVRE